MDVWLFYNLIADTAHIASVWSGLPPFIWRRFNRFYTIGAGTFCWELVPTTIHAYLKPDVKPACHSWAPVLRFPSPIAWLNTSSGFTSVNLQRFWTFRWYHSRICTVLLDINLGPPTYFCSACPSVFQTLYQPVALALESKYFKKIVCAVCINLNSTLCWWMTTPIFPRDVADPNLILLLLNSDKSACTVQSLWIPLSQST